MNTIGLWTINANIQLVTALLLIVILLMYIAYKLSQGTTHRSSKKTV